MTKLRAWYVALEKFLKISPSLLFGFLIFGTPSSSNAQDPLIKFGIIYWNDANDGVVLADNTPSWNYTINRTTNGHMTFNSYQSGTSSVNGRTGTFHSDSRAELSGYTTSSGGGGSNGSNSGKQRVVVQAWKQPTALINLTKAGSSQATLNQSIGSMHASESYTGGYSGIMTGPLSSSISFSNESGSDSATTGGSTTVFVRGACGAGNTYYPIGSLSLTHDTRATVGYQSIWNTNGISGNAIAQATLDIDVVLGNEPPVTTVTGPFNGSGTTPINYPVMGQAFNVNHDSYDPDDRWDGSSVSGVCSRSWLLTDPEGVTTARIAINNFNYTPSKVGRHTFALTVTDNEDQQTTATKVITIDRPRDCVPGATRIKPRSCSDDKTSVEVDPFCGVPSITSHDPTATRGNPLRNEIRISTDPHTLPLQQWMGNGYFTYGTQIVVSGSPAQRTLVDGYGNRYAYGTQSSGSNPKTAGVYPTLTQNGSGFTLNGAGSPQAIHKAGNFTYQFNTAGRLISITDPNGNVQSVTYNTSNQPIAVTDVSSGKDITFIYDNNKISEVVENGGFAVREIAYNSSGLISDITTKDASDNIIRQISITYDSQGHLGTFTRDNDPATTATFEYDFSSAGRPRVNVLYPSSTSTNIDYFAPLAYGATYATHITNYKGGVSKFYYSATGDLIKMIEPPYAGSTASGVVHTYTYDTNHNMLTENDGAVTTTYTYNSFGLVTRRENNAGHYMDLTYSGKNLIQVSDNIGTLFKLFYTHPTRPNAVTSFQDGALNSWILGRNSYGQLTSITPPSGSPSGTVTLTYDETSSSPTLGWLKNITDGGGNQIDIDSYSPLGDPTSVTATIGSGVTQTIQRAYDATQRETDVVFDDGKTIEKVYTGENLTSFDDEAGTTFNYSYCTECGKLTGVAGPMSWSLGWTLDEDKDIDSFQDALSNSTEYHYGFARELSRIDYPDSTYLKYFYDDYGRLNKTTNGRDQDINYTYDSAGRLYQVGFPSTSQTTQTINYRADDRLLNASDEVGTTSYEYFDNRLLKAIVYDYSTSGLTPTQRVEYTYNNDNSLASLTWKSGGVTQSAWTYGYNAAGRLTSVSSFGRTTTYTYDGIGKILSQTNPNNTQTQYAYNTARNWPTQIKHTGLGTTFAQYDLTYDSGNNTVGNLTLVTEPGSRSVSYGYDALYRLTSESRSGTGAYSKSYGYDLAGNLLTLNSSTFAAYDDANKISSLSSGRITHDDDGNILTVSGAGISSSTLQWEARSKLTSQATSSTTTTHGYDYQGRRAWSQIGSDTKKFYIFSGDLLLGEIDNTNGALFAYTWGPDGLVSRRNLQDSVTEWYHFGPQAETRALTNVAGQVVSTYSYDAYGNPLCSTEVSNNPFRYGGKVGYYSEGTTGLVLAGARWYSPNLRRWMSRDPIGYEGGENLHEYVQGNPTRYIDPTGFDTLVVFGGKNQNSMFSNPFGHVAIATTGSGMYSYGTGTPLGGGVSSYLVNQGKYREQVLYIIPTLLEEEKRIIGLLNRDYPEDNLRKWYSTSGDSCAKRVANALNAADLGTASLSARFPYHVRGYMNYLTTKRNVKIVNVPMNGKIDDNLIGQFESPSP